jgi:hypothetical protein
MKITP